MVQQRSTPHPHRPRGWFTDLYYHYKDLARRRRWRLLTGELIALSWSLFVLAAASLPHAFSIRIRRWVGHDCPKSCRPPVSLYRRRSDLTFAAVAVFALISILLPAAPDPALVEGAIDFDAVAEPDTLINLLANNESPIFATVGATNPLIAGESPWGRNEQRGGVVPGVLSAPDPRVAILRPSTTTPAKPAARAVPPEGLVHVVTSGENLWDICQAYQVKLDDVITWNDLADPNRLSLERGYSFPAPKLHRRSKCSRR